MIREIITLLREKTTYKYHFEKADVNNLTDNDVVYSYQGNGDDSIKKGSRLTLTIITKGINENSILKAEKIKSKINSCIVTFGDEQLTNSILSVVQNGGGVLENKVTNTLHTIMYYDIIHR